ncbi:LBP_cg2779 family protein [Limosilactobacillus mucosae]|uniref:LBP_cg2779 family protein n=1 Tax=Lactobacillaceae TaxID=33958 RepID=UPI00146E1CF3|nr:MULTISPECIES: LBP_cg2779 family protein [Lactobacillaceae]MDD6864508.1 LBP_cg2779 family protein [Lactobacillus sp.]MDC2836755.1 LBP_cg2779 family protein [Limosilactobacillus mucosae]MDC2848935.1 LBP_cg2779 family protein [Limosilactobacillus mucosae]MDC2853341.1 LBP_cg2779 family protein [Limosilactobacillus mucosae]MDD6893077.1 LBP_cg2779 family protein [Lactobacillus sp.]
MSEPVNSLAAEIIEFERIHEMTDNQVAFGSQMSVERVHDIKSQSDNATDEESSLLRRFMQAKH